MTTVVADVIPEFIGTIWAALWNINLNLGTIVSTLVLVFVLFVGVTMVIALFGIPIMLLKASMGPARVNDPTFKYLPGFEPKPSQKNGLK
jgi:hypothetical protein